MERDPAHTRDVPADPFPQHEAPGGPAAQDPPGQETLGQEDKLWAIVAHLSGLLGFFLVAPLVILLVMKDSNPFVAREAQEALNFHITLILLAFASTLLILAFGLGLLVLPVVGALALVLPILAAIRVGDGSPYHYPLTVRLVALV